MPKFKSELVRLRKQLCKVPEKGDIGMQVGRRLKKDHPQLTRLSHRLDALQKAAQRIGSIFQATKVRDHLMCFSSKAKIRRRAANPVLERRGRGESAKRDIQFYGI